MSWTEIEWHPMQPRWTKNFAGPSQAFSTMVFCSAENFLGMVGILSFCISASTSGLGGPPAQRDVAAAVQTIRRAVARSRGIEWGRTQRRQSVMKGR